LRTYCVSKSKRVFIVREGIQGKVKREDADNVLKTAKRLLESVQLLKPGTNENVPFSVEVVETAQEIERLPYPRPHVVIFNSRSMIAAARRLKKRMPTTKVIVMTRLVPKDEVLFVAKNWLASGALEIMVFE
jgi:DNA-binding NarL/FixJ family response regulator